MPTVNTGCSVLLLVAQLTIPLHRIVRLVFILLITVHDVAFAVYVRFYSVSVAKFVWKARK